MTAGYFHLNPQGNPGRCTAEEGNCPFGGMMSHYPTEERARQAFELSMASSTFGGHEALIPSKIARVRHQEIMDTTRAELQAKLGRDRYGFGNNASVAILEENLAALERIRYNPSLTATENRIALVMKLNTLQMLSCEEKLRAKTADEPGGYAVEAHMRAQHVMWAAAKRAIMEADGSVVEARTDTREFLRKGLSGGVQSPTFRRLVDKELSLVDSLSDINDEEDRRKTFEVFATRRAQAVKTMNDLSSRHHGRMMDSEDGATWDAHNIIHQAYGKGMDALARVNE